MGKICLRLSGARQSLKKGSSAVELSRDSSKNASDSTKTTKKCANNSSKATHNANSSNKLIKQNGEVFTNKKKYFEISPIYLFIYFVFNFSNNRIFLSKNKLLVIIYPLIRTFSSQSFCEIYNSLSRNAYIRIHQYF